MNLPTHAAVLAERFDIQGPPCTACRGTGDDPTHRWPDGSPAACEACDGCGALVTCNPEPSHDPRDDRDGGSSNAAW